MEITIIHGTWAKKPQWANGNSLLRKSLKSNFPDIKVNTFNWSGSNRVSKRKEGEQQLIQFLKDRNTEQFLIAHSHGGNLAVGAIQDKSLEIKGIVTMGTPFFFIIKRDIRWLIEFISKASGISLIIVSFLIFFSSMKSTLWVIVLSIMGLLLIVFSKKITTTLDNNSNKADPEYSNEPPLLSLISGEDEAIGWLQFFDNLSNLPSLLLGKWAFRIFLIAIYFISIFKFYDQIATIIGSFGYSPSVFSFFMASLFVLVAFYIVLVTLSFLLSSTLRGLSQGSNIISKTNLTERVAVTLTPIGYKNVEFRNIVLATNLKTTLAHSALHSDQKTIDIIIDWMRLKIAEHN